MQKKESVELLDPKSDIVFKAILVKTMNSLMEREILLFPVLLEKKLWNLLWSKMSHHKQTCMQKK